MIHAVLIFNTHGKPRLSKFYTPLPALVQQSLIAQIFSLISDRPAGVCNFLDAPDLVFPSVAQLRSGEWDKGAVMGGGGGGGGLAAAAAAARRSKGKGRKLVGGGSGSTDEVDDLEDEDEVRVIYRHYATLYFVFVVDGAESELGILDLIQVFVESLDRSFENVCELDLIFHFDEVHHVLAEIIQGGLVLETNINEITSCVQVSSRNRKASAASANTLIPSAFTSAGAGGSGRNLSRGGGSADGPRRWLAAIGV